MAETAQIFCVLRDTVVDVPPVEVCRTFRVEAVGALCGQAETATQPTTTSAPTRPSRRLSSTPREGRRGRRRGLVMRPLARTGRRPADGSRSASATFYRARL